jgi:hypothetical protein
MAVTMKMAVFWVAAPCRLVRVYRRFRGLYCLHHQDVLRYNPEDSHLQVTLSLLRCLIFNVKTLMNASVLRTHARTRA